MDARLIPKAFGTGMTYKVKRYTYYSEAIATQMFGQYMLCPFRINILKEILDSLGDNEEMQSQVRSLPLFL
jgi:hypothetical protein